MKIVLIEIWIQNNRENSIKKLIIVVQSHLERMKEESLKEKIKGSKKHWGPVFDLYKFS